MLSVITGGSIFAIILTAITLVGMVVGYLFAWSVYDKGRLVAFTSIAGGLILLLVAVGMWPWKHDYHYWIDKRGTIEQVSKRLVSDGDNGMQEKIVVRLDTGVFGVTETRATLLKRGDKIHLRCKRAYEWGTPYQAHGWDCKYVSSSLDRL
jgi:hypothetical protein